MTKVILKKRKGFGYGIGTPPFEPDIFRSIEAILQCLDLGYTVTIEAPTEREATGLIIRLKDLPSAPWTVEREPSPSEPEKGTPGPVDPLGRLMPYNHERKRTMCDGNTNTPIEEKLAVLRGPTNPNEIEVIVSDSITHFEKEINECLKDGWELYGSPSFLLCDDRIICHQMMGRYFDNEPEQEDSPSEPGEPMLRKCEVCGGPGPTVYRASSDAGAGPPHTWNRYACKKCMKGSD